MLDILNFAFQSFWHFIGCLLIVTMCLRFPIAFIRSISDWHNTRKHGWKPSNKVQLKDLLKEEDGE